MWSGKYVYSNSTCHHDCALSSSWHIQTTLVSTVIRYSLRELLNRYLQDYCVLWQAHDELADVRDWRVGILAQGSSSWGTIWLIWGWGSLNNSAPTDWRTTVGPAFTECYHDNYNNEKNGQGCCHCCAADASHYKFSKVLNKLHWTGTQLEQIITFTRTSW